MCSIAGATWKFVGQFVAALLSLGAVIGLVFGFTAWVQSESKAASDDVERKFDLQWEAHGTSHSAIASELDVIQGQMVLLQRQVAAGNELQQVTIGLIAEGQRRDRDD